MHRRQWCTVIIGIVLSLTLVLLIYARVLFRNSAGEEGTPSIAHPRLDPGCRILDLGAGQQGQVLSGQWSLRNIGAAPLKYVIRASCACAWVKPAHGEIPPGEEQIIQVGVRLRQTGQTERVSLLVETDDPEQTEVIYEVYAHCPPILRIEPAQVDFGRVLRGTKASSCVRVQRGIHPVSKVMVRSSTPHLRSSFSLQGPEEGLLRVELLPDTPAGRVEEKVYLNVGQEEVVLPVLAEICPPILVAPSHLFVRADGSQTWECIAWRFDRQPLGALQQIHSTLPELQVQVQDISAAESAERQLRIHLFRFPKGTEEAQLQLYFQGIREPAEISLSRISGKESTGPSKEVNP
jgi:hypothetical protein